MDTKTALTCLVPAFPVIQTVRQGYDPAYDRWMPHFNIECFPFLPEGEIGNHLQTIQTICQKYGPLTIALPALGMFPAFKKKPGTLFVQVVEASGQLQRLRDDLGATFGGIGGGKPFQPHVTLARFETQSALQAFHAQLQWSPMEIKLTGLHYIARGATTAFAVKYFFPFGKSVWETVVDAKAVADTMVAPQKSMQHKEIVGAKTTDKTTVDKIGDKLVADKIGDKMAADKIGDKMAADKTGDKMAADKIGDKTTEAADKIGDEMAANPVDDVSVAILGDYCIVHVPANIQSAKPVIIKNVLLIDNSGSMGSQTREAIHTIGKGLFALNVPQLPGVVVMFNEEATVVADNVRSSADLDRLQYPKQGQTNITAGVLKALHVLTTTAVPGTHHLMTFLSDGQHNCGPLLTDAQLTGMRQHLDSHNISLTVNVVGVTSSSNTTLGMKIKAGLETTPMPQLESVYFAPTPADMPKVLQALVAGCVQSVGSGSVRKIFIQHGVFIETAGTETTSFVGPGGYMAALKKTSSTAALRVWLDGKEIHVRPRDLKKEDLTVVMDTIVPKWSRIKIAHGTSGIRHQMDLLNHFIDTFEAMHAALHPGQSPDHIGKSKLTPLDRVAMLKTVAHHKGAFLEERNKLRQLDATLANDSAQQANYLTGITKKYGAKAVLRADTLTVTPAQVLQELQTLQHDLRQAVAADRHAHAGMHTDAIATSILALTNPYEQFCEWLDTVDSTTARDYTDIFSLLVALGFPAYSVRFQHNHAVQADPFQTECTFLEPCPVDTCSVLLTQQLKRPIVSFSHQPITDGLILIHPMMPATSCLLFRSKIYEYLCSVTLCRDLYMYHPKMTFSMHAHALVQAVAMYGSTTSKSYLDLAVRIVYSIRKYWGDKLCTAGANVELFLRWWRDWHTLTQSEADACHHPAQLLLMLGAFQVPGLGCDLNASAVPLLTLLNETMARKLRIKLKGCAASGAADGDTKELAVTTLQQLYGITADNSPRPHPDVLQPEPTLEAVREACVRYAAVVDATALRHIGVTTDINTFVTTELLPYAHTFHFCLAVQRFDPAKMVAHLEKGENHAVVDYLAAQIHTKVPLWEQLDPTTTSPSTLYQTMFVQALLLHDSSSRSLVNQTSVLDSSTLADLIVDLRMAFYFQACKVKKTQWLAIIGNVTEAEALTCDETVFESMLGLHTHGLTKERFWALVRASKAQPEKKKLFLQRSNTFVAYCYDKI